MTLGELLREAAERLAVAGVASPRVDAELLAAEAFALDRAGLQARVRDPAPDSAAFEQLLARRVRREPLQHIVGTAPFRHLLVSVGPGVFIPRPETELLVDAALPLLRTLAQPTLVDLCSGSGAIAISVAQEAPHTRVIAVEADSAALPWLRRNAGARVTVVEGDVRDPGLLGDLRGVDVVTCNPPYVPELTPVDPEVRADPPQAVFAGSDGLALMAPVIERAADLLRAGGLLVIEHDDTHGVALPALLLADGRWGDVADHRDLSGRPRYVVAVRA